MRSKVAGAFVFVLFVWVGISAVRAGDAFLALLCGLALGATVAGYVVDFALWQRRRKGLDA